MKLRGKSGKKNKKDSSGRKKFAWNKFCLYRRITMNLSCYKDKRILVTGHTGFKGSWMSMLLLELGANVYGYAQEPPTNPSMFKLCGLQDKMKSYRGDIRDLEHLQGVFEEVQPEIVIHMAAQPLVRDSYKHPVYTYETNVIGTVNVLECVRKTDSVKSVVNVTTDKVYKNMEQNAGYVETDELNGYDPYSNSKSCSELVTSSYINSFLRDKGVAVSTVRAGNVIGGGDFAADRIIPDCVRAAMTGKDIIIRNPYSIRPFQHVLEPVVAYLMIAMEQWCDEKKCGSYNIGPKDEDCWETGKLTDLFCDTWESVFGEKVHWINQHDDGPHEAGFLKLDCTKAHHVFGWEPKWNMKTNMEKIVQWTKVYADGGDVSKETVRQIREYLG